MNKKLKILAIIPARSGSKGIPNKNIKKLSGRPLIYYTIKAALNSKLIDRIIVSSDSEKILKISEKLGAEIPFKRPKNISEDKSLAIEVIQHALNWLEKNEKYFPDAIIYLQPTSPLRTKKHINEAINIFFKESSG
jgi:CMP-N-acetylneuraminic acid synthetase